MTERLLKDCVRTGHIKWSRAHRTKTYQKRRLQTLRQCNGASIIYLVFVEDYLGYGLVYLVVNQSNAGTHLAAERLHSCAACGRHTWTTARK